MRAVLTAIGSTPVGANPSASSSWRLNSESPSARSTRPASVCSSWRPSAARRKSCGVVGREERRRRDVVVLQHAPAGQRRERLGHRRRQREMEDRDVAAPRRRSANGRTSSRRSSSIVSAKMSDWCPRRRSMSRTTRALSPIASPRVRRRHPLVDDHGRRWDRVRDLESARVAEAIWLEARLSASAECRVPVQSHAPPVQPAAR